MVKMITKRNIVLFGGIILIIFSTVLVISGSYFAIFMRNINGPDGYTSSKISPFHTETYALSSLDIPIDLNNFIPGYLQFLAPDDGIIVRLTATTNNSKDLFIGLGDSNEVQTYLSTIEHQVATSYQWRISSRNVSLDLYEATYSMGGAPLKAPDNETFWMLKDNGEQSVSLTTPMRSGTYRLVFMNADASSSIDAHIQLAARFPYMDKTIMLLFISGIILGIIGVYLTIFKYLQKK
ncbi:MAG: hypothetical protein V1769_01105 [Thermoplasmatota archaeon]